MRFQAISVTMVSPGRPTSKPVRLGPACLFKGLLCQFPLSSQAKVIESYQPFKYLKESRIDQELWVMYGLANLHEIYIPNIKSIPFTQRKPLWILAISAVSGSGQTHRRPVHQDSLISSPSNKLCKLIIIGIQDLASNFVELNTGLYDSCRIHAFCHILITLVDGNVRLTSIGLVQSIYCLQAK